MKTILSTRNQAKAVVLGIQHAFFFIFSFSLLLFAVGIAILRNKLQADICKLIWKQACMHG